MTIELVDVYYIGTPKPAAVILLYTWLAQRQPHQSISHAQMPTMEQHQHFVAGHPYQCWYLIRELREGAPHFVGNIYLTRMREVGIHIDANSRGNGFGSKALDALRKLHAGKILANINPKNTQSIAFFTKHGAKLLQHTYVL